MLDSIGVLIGRAGVCGVVVESSLDCEVRLQLNQDRLRRAILNLGENAIDAMSSGGGRSG